MSDFIISVENLGKKYRIRHEQRERYTALRDVLARSVKGFGSLVWGAGRRLASGLLSSSNGSNPSHLTPNTYNPPPDLLTSDLRPPTSDPHAPSSLLHAPASEDFWALRGVSFEVKEGEVVGIIGRNGAGKSTVLKILSRITEPTEGRVRIRGRVASLLEVGTGFHPELTGRENVFLNGAVLGMAKAEIKRKFDEIVAFAEVEKFIDTPVKRYSSGMYVRLAFAVAAHLEPEILLVDEVLAVGDAAFQKKCLGKMGEVAKEGRTVLFVSHNMTAISTLCSRAALLDRATIVNSGRTSEVIDAYLSQFRDGPGGQDPELSYPNEPTRPAQIKRVCVLGPHGEPSLNHNVLDPILVEVDFVVRRGFPNLFVSCTVLTNMDQIVFTTNEMDWSNFTAPKRNGIFPKEPAEYRASVVLPAPLLPSGIYELWLALSDQKTPGNLENRRGIFIEVSDNGGSFATFPFKRAGFVALPIEWQVKRRDRNVTEETLSQ